MSFLYRKSDVQLIRCGLSSAKLYRCPQLRRTRAYPYPDCPRLFESILYMFTPQHHLLRSLVCVRIMSIVRATRPCVQSIALNICLNYSCLGLRFLGDISFCLLSRTIFMMRRPRPRGLYSWYCGVRLMSCHTHPLLVDPLEGFLEHYEHQ